MQSATYKYHEQRRVHGKSTHERKTIREIRSVGRGVMAKSSYALLRAPTSGQPEQWESSKGKDLVHLSWIERTLGRTCLNRRTNSFAHLLAHAHAHSLAHSHHSLMLACSFDFLFARSHSHSLARTLIHSHTCSFTHSLTRSSESVTV